jgi:hypothetical protein
MSVMRSKEITRTTTTTASRISTIFAVAIAVALVAAAGLTASVLAIKSSASTNSSTGLKKFFDCVSKSAKNGKPSRLDVDYCYDSTYSPNGGVSTSASAGNNGASAAASAGIP